MPKYLHTNGLVIKRFNYADADRFVTILTPTFGKISCLAKGVRRLKSRKRTALEPLNQIKLVLYETGRGYTVTEAEIIESYPSIKQSLSRLTQASQFLEIIEGLIGEDEAHERLYYQVISTIKAIETNVCTKESQLEVIKEILMDLGFGVPFDDEIRLKNHIEEITQRPLRSKQYYLGII